MRQVKIVKVKGHYDNYHDEWREAATSGSNWLDVDDETVVRLEQALRWANLNSRNEWKYTLIYNMNLSDFDEIFTSAQQVIDKYEKERVRQEKVAADAKAKREATALARKQKQLEKLKRELGDT